MKDGYGQFCPIAKATEIFATRWTPLVLRELMSGACTFNDIHRGVPQAAVPTWLGGPATLR
jgi:DNA-binding HxlR family transcriptional regulator